MKDLPITMDEPANWIEKTGGYAKDMTLRDYFAAKALQGLIEHGWNTMNDEEHAKTAYQIADAMLNARTA
jgi:hypothetical protein